MKKSNLWFLLLLFSGVLSAQSVKVDSSFGVNGQLITDIIDDASNAYGMDQVRLPTGGGIFVGEHPWQTALRKYNDNGTLDSSFLVEIPHLGLGYTLALQKDGHLLLCAVIDTSPYHTVVVRVDTAGVIDSTFGINGFANVNLKLFHAQVAALSSGKIIVYGTDYLWPENIFPVVVAQLNPDGSMDTTFGQKGYFSVQPFDDIILLWTEIEQSDGKIIVGGLSGKGPLLVRLHPNGVIDQTFSDDGVMTDKFPQGGEFYSLAVQPDGKIVANGYGYPEYRPIVVRYNPDGSRDSSFSEDGVHFCPDFPKYTEGIGIKIFPDGKILSVISHYYYEDLSLLQLLPNGERDPSFGNNGVYRYPFKYRSRSATFDDNKIVVTAREPDDNKRILLRFLLDFSVGTIHPNAPEAESVWVYPNPIAAQFSLKFNLIEPCSASIRLYDMSGKGVQTLVENQAFGRGEQEVPLFFPAGLPAGNYVLSLEIAGKRMTSVQIFKK